MAASKRLDVTYKEEEQVTWSAYQQVNDISNDQEIYLVMIEGWDEETNIVYNSEPKAVGKGSYLISTSENERVLEVEINTNFATELELRQFRRNLLSQSLQVRELMLTRVYVEGEIEWTETITGYITSISGWDQNEQVTTLRFTVTCYNPEIISTMP